MVLNYKVPGVYVEEIPSARSIQGVSTDVAFFLGIPVNYPLADLSYPKGYPAKPTTTAPLEPVLITSWSNYQAIFGGFVWNCYLAYAVYNFFSLGGTACYVMNAISPDSPASTFSRYVPAGTTGYTYALTKTAAMGKNSSVKLKGVSDDNVDPPTDSPSSIAICVASYSLNAAADGLTSDIYIVTDYTNPPAKDKTTGDIIPQANPVFTISVLVPIKTIDPDKDNTSNQLLQLYAQKNNAGTYSYTGSGTTTQYYVLEKFTGFSGVDLKINPTTKLANIQKIINGNSLFITVSITNTDKQIVPALDAKPQPVGSTIKLGLQKDVSNTDDLVDLLQSMPTVSMVAAPDIVSEDLPDQTALLNIMLSAVEQTSQAILVADSPYFSPSKTGNTENILSFVQGGEGSALNSTFGAIYYPWVWTMNPNSGVQIMVPPSGMVTGRYAYTSSAVGVFAAPAGIQEGQLRAATDVSEFVNYGDQELLNPAGINVIKSLLNYGICIWGARTFSQSGLFYVNVRRLLIYVEQSIQRSLQWVVFESNNSMLWGTIVRDISAFLTTLWQQGALVGASAAEAFYVTCNASNNPPETMQQGYLFVDVGIAPVTPAEFVVIRIAQKLESN